jgi:hypothetical protein
VYSRSYQGRELHFEASGGLVNSSLVLQDRETDSYWSIMKGRSTAGRLRGTKLVELPDSEKVRWADWVARHPDTRVLSVRGREYARDSYEDYWRDPSGFRGQRAKDRRLETKEPIFAFEHEGERYAVSHKAIRNGHVVELSDDIRLFLFRPGAAPMFESTRAFVSRAGFVRDADRWIELESGATFDPVRGRFRGARVRSQRGFDTFWYNWSLNNPDTRLLE